MSDTKNNLGNIALKEIRENPVALRQVNRTTEAYMELVDSIKKEGVLNPIVVRPMTDPTTGDKFYGLIDGLHRYTASMDAGLTDIPAHIKSMEDAQVLISQIITNIHKIETRPVEYSKQLQKILAQDPLLTAASLAAQLGKSVTWLSERLGLLKLDDSLKNLVDEGKINLSNAFSLARLPKEEQATFVDRAMTMSPQEFAPTILNRKKELDTARRRGEDAAPAEFKAPAHLRTIKEVRGEMENPVVGPNLVRSVGFDDLKTKGEVADRAWKLAVQWVLHQDPASVDIAKKKDEDRRKELQDKRDLANKAKVKDRAEEASLKAARLQLEADAIAAKKTDDEIKAELKAFDDAHGLVDGKKPAPVKPAAAA